MAETIAYSGLLVTTSCWCGMHHAVPQELREKQERDHRDGRKQVDIYCPLGHSYIIAGEGEAARLERRLVQERERSARIDAEREQAEAKARAQKGHATRLRKRAQAGVCPCCKRTFKQLARHMENKHPEFADA